MQNENITPHRARLTLAERQAAIGVGAVCFMTGLSGSGKSTVGAYAEKLLIDRGVNTFLLDGDTTRMGLCRGLGFSPEGRAENIRRIAEAARLLAEAGVKVIVSVIAPSSELRQMARETVEGAGLAFYEVYVSASVEVCAARDPKGLYRRAIAGEIPEFTGVSAPYDVPESPDLTLDTAAHSVEECAEELVKLLSLQRK